EDFAISTLRGKAADNRAWSADPSKPAVICGTVDMIGSRLLFSGYGAGFKTRPLLAGLLGQDTLVIHDEAHLEPAFQRLLESIEEEQRRAGDRALFPLRLMSLTATSRSQEASDPFSLSQDDEADEEVARRLCATKRLTLKAIEDEKKLPDAVFARALKFKSSGRAVLVFLRTVENVSTVAKALKEQKQTVQVLTGTLRGLERDGLVNDGCFQRFLRRGGDTSETQETVFLVCTSAGEVGVDLSADDLICDLSTFDSMAQRLGRLNRFGQRDDSTVTVFHPRVFSHAEKIRKAEAAVEEASDDQKRKDAEEKLESLRQKLLAEVAREKTLELLRSLKGDASPKALSALSALDPEERRQAFTPEPEILPATELLFDAWALTSITGTLPGRPPVDPFLHGIAEWVPPTTQVAWRDEVDLIDADALRDRYAPADLLDDFPLEPHELLSDRSERVLETLLQAVEKHPKNNSAPCWLIDKSGDSVKPMTLGEIAKAMSGQESDLKKKEKKKDWISQNLAYATLLLSPAQSHPVAGMLSVDGFDSTSSSDDRADVSCDQRDENDRPLRARCFDDEPAPPGMRLLRTIDLVDDELSATSEDESDGSARHRIWRWFEAIPTRDSGSAVQGEPCPVSLEEHTSDVVREAERLVKRLALRSPLARAVVAAAKLHDSGKKRRVWQRTIGNDDPDLILAKSGGSNQRAVRTSFRHELGSLIDAEQGDLLQHLSPEERDLALHLVAAHHGRARPLFFADEQFDPEAKTIDVAALCERSAIRFAQLQRRHGRWGLAYLESLLRAADYAVSAVSSATAAMEGSK
ncbi:MAG: type I-U CRISPR-associated helicase/endonuclease Cas3, partial [Myxococcales bacterium]|nr:type I-U CRISPR-associated helicase/endonuclease Cas3 [Myxococcales bacterium]